MHLKEMVNIMCYNHVRVLSRSVYLSVYFTNTVFLNLTKIHDPRCKTLRCNETNLVQLTHFIENLKILRDRP